MWSYFKACSLRLDLLWTEFLVPSLRFDFIPVETLDCSPSLSFCHSSGQARRPRKSAKSGSLLDSWILDLQIYAVTPIPESQEVLQREGVPDNIKSFYKVNHIWKFRYDRPFHKGTKDKENEFKVLSNSYDTWFPQIEAFSFYQDAC